MCVFLYISKICEICVKYDKICVKYVRLAEEPVVTTPRLDLPSELVKPGGAFPSILVKPGGAFPSKLVKPGGAFPSKLVNPGGAFPSKLVKPGKVVIPVKTFQTYGENQTSLGIPEAHNVSNPSKVVP